jgi:putative restriction endonuclease
MLDSSVFKRLSHNDSGQSRGHQGGIVIPKDLAEFFPPLPLVATALNPTVDVRLKADLFVDGARIASVETRYQHQTWGGTRPAERRLTDNLGPLRNVSSEGDIVLFTKDLADDDYLQIHLVRSGTKEHDRLNSLLSKARWGSVDPKDPPVSVTEIRAAEAFVDAQTKEKPNAFMEDRKTFETTTIRKARDRAFRNAVLAQYDYRCAFTERKFVSPLSARTMGLDAAHVIPVNDKGSDHPANGLPLTKELHWAFDRGLIGVNIDRTILVPKSVAALVGNEFLKGLHGRSIQEAKHPMCRALDEAFAWHRANVLVG